MSTYVDNAGLTGTDPLNVNYEPDGTSLDLGEIKSLGSEDLI